MGTTRRPALALARPHAPAARLRPHGARRQRSRRQGLRRLGLRRRGLVLALVCAVAVAGLAYLLARESSLFAVRVIAIEGAPEPVAAEVRAALRPLEGESLVAIGAGAVERRLEALPSVRAAEVDRDFPSTLRVAVTPERAVAVLRRGGQGFLVAASGTVIREVKPSARGRLPRVWLPTETEAPRPGLSLAPDQGAAAVALLALLPRDFPARVASARGASGALTLVLAGSRAEIRLGEAEDLALKLEVAATVLQALEPKQQLELAYLDVSLPARVVAATKSQVDG